MVARGRNLRLRQLARRRRRRTKPLRQSHRLNDRQAIALERAVHRNRRVYSKQTRALSGRTESSSSAPRTTRGERKALRGRLPLALARLTPEEQRLAGHGRDHRELERLGDEERRFRPFSGEEAFRVGGNENHWRRKRAE